MHKTCVYIYNIYTLNSSQSDFYLGPPQTKITLVAANLAECPLKIGLLPLKEPPFTFSKNVLVYLSFRGGYYKKYPFFYWNLSNTNTSLTLRLDIQKITYQKNRHDFMMLLTIPEVHLSIFFSKPQRPPYVHNDVSKKIRILEMDGAVWILNSFIRSKFIRSKLWICLISENSDQNPSANQN